MSFAFASSLCAYKAHMQQLSMDSTFLLNAYGDLAENDLRIIVSADLIEEKSELQITFILKRETKPRFIWKQGRCHHAFVLAPGTQLLRMSR